MAKQVKINAERRSATGRAAVRKLKARGSVPAVIYGAKHQAEALQVSKKEISSVLSHAAGENVLVELQIDGDSRMALVQEVQHSPLGGDILHIDFHAVSMDEAITAEVPVEPTGLPIGVKTYGGLLEQSVRSLAIECLPRDLPDVISVNVEELNVGNAIHVRDLKLPEGVTAKMPPDLTVFSVLAPTVEEEPTSTAPEAAASPEVIKEKKETPAPGAAPGAAPAKDAKK